MKSNSIKLGSHNSFSYLPVRQWWMKPFRFVGRCQRVSIEKQLSLGVTFFDLRLRFDTKGRPIICHGLMEFKMGFDGYIDQELSYCDSKKNITIRVVLELNKRDEIQEKYFIDYCKYLEEKYPHITFVGGNNRLDWNCLNPIYDFKNKLPELSHKYSSTTSLFKIDNDLIAKIDDWIPYFYASRFNHFMLKRPYDESTYLFIDFVDIR